MRSHFRGACMRLSTRLSTRLACETAFACVLTVFALSPAFAHATLEADSTKPGAYKAVMRIPHGCGDKPTDSVRIDLPEGFIAAKPMPKAGWTVEVESGDYAKTYDYFGRELKSGPKAIVWSGGSLPSNFYDEFVISGRIADVAEGETLFFPTTQTCDVDTVSWSEIPAKGQDPHALDHPAPGLLILASKTAAAGHGHGNGHGGHMQMASDTTASPAHDSVAPVMAGDLVITGYWTRAMLPGQPVGGGFMSIANNGAGDDRLIEAATDAAGHMELHTMEVVDGVMKMRQLADGIPVPAGQTVELKPGGLHVMFMNVPTPFVEGGMVKVTLTFEKAGKVDLVMPVMPRDAKGMGNGHGGMKHGALDDKGEIERVLKAQFETPANRLTVEPVTVRGDWAVAGWMQDGRGGRGLLKRGMHGWSVHMCSGESLRQAAALSSAGLAQADAEALAAAVNDAEKALAADRIALLDSFDGTIMIGEGQAHGHAHN